MQKELEVWRFAERKLSAGKPVVLLVVADSKGSSPGRQGFKMAVCGDEMCGSIGGGVMEVNLVQSVRGKAQSGKTSVSSEHSAIVEQVHRKNSPNPSGMICSGKQAVIFRKLQKGDLKTVRKIIGGLEQYEPVILRITNKEFVLLSETNVKPPKSGTQNFARTSDGEFLYEEKLGYKNHLHIIGGGHCALALSELMSKLDFHISVFDDRPELNTLEKNSFAHKKAVVETYEHIAGNIPSGNTTYVVVMTLGYKSDETVIRSLAKKKFRYLGVLGSRAKMKTLLKSLEQEGVSRKYLSSIRTPIGLPINSRTPEEIAVSIAAEIIAIKNKA